MLLMTKELEKKFEKYPLYSQEDKGFESDVIVKYFNPCGTGTWLITEGENKKMVIGYFTAIAICSNGNGAM